MARIVITGSSEGLGLMAGERLAGGGHEVILHARSDRRAEDARRALPQAKAVVIGDLSSLAGMRSVADQVNALGRPDAVIHNVGVGYREPRRILTDDGFSQLFAVNTLAPYVLTALIERPDRLVYLSSGLHCGGDPDLSDLQWEKRPWNGMQAYSDTKLHDAQLAFAIARRWPEVRSNAVEPGWVATRMGGAGATDDLAQGPVTQAWLAVSDDRAAQASGRYFFHQDIREPAPAAERTDLQDGLLDYCEALSGIALPA